MSHLPHNLHPQTLAIHEAIERSVHKETSETLYLNSGYCYETAQKAEDMFNDTTDGYLYSRFSNPTVKSFEKRLAGIEEAEAAKATSTGMSAIFTCLMSLLQSGDHILANAVMFSSCRYIIEEILPHYGISCSFVDNSDIQAWKNTIQPNTKILFTETPVNPNNTLTDIQELSMLSKEKGALLIVDNAMASPIIQRPLDLGADIVIYSTTKHIDGQGRCLGGAILGTSSYIDDILMPFYKHTGAALSPFNAWIMLKGLETLHIRVDAQCQNALTIAKWLETSSKVHTVNYPYLPSHPHHSLARKQMTQGGTMISFHVGQTKEQAYQFLNNLKVILISNNLGDTKSLMTHPATTTHKIFSDDVKRNNGITDTLIRFSVGLEYKDDLMADIEQALTYTQ